MPIGIKAVPTENKMMRTCDHLQKCKSLSAGWISPGNQLQPIWPPQHPVIARNPPSWASEEDGMLGAPAALASNLRSKLIVTRQQTRWCIHRGVRPRSPHQHQQRPLTFRLPRLCVQGWLFQLWNSFLCHITPQSAQHSSSCPEGGDSIPQCRRAGSSHNSIRSTNTAGRPESAGNDSANEYLKVHETIVRCLRLQRCGVHGPRSKKNTIHL